MYVCIYVYIYIHVQLVFMYIIYASNSIIEIPTLWSYYCIYIYIIYTHTGFLECYPKSCKSLHHFALATHFYGSQI